MMTIFNCYYVIMISITGASKRGQRLKSHGRLDCIVSTLIVDEFFCGLFAGVHRTK